MCWAIIVLVYFPRQSKAGNSNSNYDTSVYGMSMQRDWLYQSGSINLKYEGCVWGYVSDRENMGCMGDSSEDGTTYWYMMANCRRAQVAYSLYASSSAGGTKCKSANFKESFVTKDGVAEFAYIMGSYGYNSPISENDVSSLPLCESDGNGYYLSVGCSSSGSFTIDRFTDAYCTQYYDTYDNLKNFNYAMKSLSNCYNVYSTRTDEDPQYSLASYLIAESGTCTENESSLCTTTSFVKNSGARSSVGQRTTSKLTSGASRSFTDKLKYGLGTAMLIGSVIMFFGILFTNRKKRRAMMHRKFRSSSDKKKKSSSSSSKKRSGSTKKSKSGAGVFA